LPNRRTVGAPFGQFFRKLGLTVNIVLIATIAIGRILPLASLQEENEPIDFNLKVEFMRFTLYYDGPLPSAANELALKKSMRFAGGCTGNSCSYSEITLLYRK
jgi:hypothetical protein